MKTVQFLFMTGLLILFMGGNSVVAQETNTTPQIMETPFDKGVRTFRSGQYAEAKAIFEAIPEVDAQYAEARFMIARILVEGPEKDFKGANRQLDLALRKNPENVQYLVAKLNIIRDPENQVNLGGKSGEDRNVVLQRLSSFLSKNWIQERYRDALARELSRKILLKDPNNAFAHEEMGITYIKDYWRFRNAIAVPQYTNTNRPDRNRDRTLQAAEIQATPGTLTDPTASLEFNPGLASDPFADLVALAEKQDPFGMYSVTLNDQFDLEEMKTQGIPVKDFTNRAEYAYKKATFHLKKAQENDPMRRSVYNHLMKVYLLKEEYREAAKMLQDMYAFFGDDPETNLFIGATQYKLGNLDASTQFFDRALAKMDTPMRTAFEDIGIILPETERAAYRHDPVGYATKFWTSQNPRFLTAYNERKMEHYYRLIYADLLYSVPRLGIRGWESQRGQILIRYGVPNVEIIMEKDGPLGSRGKGWDAPVGQSVEQASEISTSQRENQFQEEIYDSRKAAKLYNIWIYPKFRFVFEDSFRNGDYVFYTPTQEDIDSGVDPYINDYELKSREIFKQYSDFYTYQANGRQVSLPYLVNTFKGKGNQADLYLHAGVPVQQYDASKPEINLNLNFGTFLIGSNRDFLVERRLTTYGMKTAQVVKFKEAQLWLYTQTMTAPAGNQTLSVEFETASGGTMGVQRRNIVVPDYYKPVFAMSDAMLAYHVAESPDNKPIHPGDVLRNGLSIRPAPWSVFDKANPIYFYFEMYNLAQDVSGKTKYQVEAQLVPKESGNGMQRTVNSLLRRKEKGVSVKFENSGTTRDDGQYLVLEAGKQETGLYTLTVRIKDLVTGKTVDRTKDLFLE
ncbi:MAG: GWxTD domain-containing protein [Bacteroidetes Order II. Incertae sedis bacterium]|nr:GWxTD domain-containing protein [Bacteroidetes Order II. bacterium]